MTKIVQLGVEFLIKLCLILGGFFIVLISGCSKNNLVGPRETLPIVEMREVLKKGSEESPQAKIPPSSVQARLLPQLDKNSTKDTARLEERFDVVVDNLPAKDFFLGLVEGTRYHMIVDPSVTGNISLQLTHVTVPQVLDIARDQYGYDYERTEYGFRIMPQGLQTRVFQINYLNLRRLGESETRVSAGQVTNAPSSTTGPTTTSTTSGVPAGGAVSGTSPTDPGGSGIATGTRIRTFTEADLWQELQKTLKLIIGEKEGRAVSATPQSGVVMVRAMPSELRAVKEYLDKTQLSVQRQVILQAKILEVELKDAFNAGIDWTAIAKVGGGRFTLRQGDNDNLLLRDFPVDAIGKELGGVFSTAVQFNDFTALIQLLQSQGNVQVLSSPQVSTINNQKAVIKVGSDEFFVTNVTTTQEDNESGDNEQTENVTLTPFFSGIALDVLPQIGDDGDVVLHVHPSVSEVVEQVKEITVNGQELILPLAFSTIRESDTVVKAKSGQIVIIGGLIQNSAKEKSSSVPLLGDMPVIGSFFRQTQQQSVKSELVILLKPTVVNDQSFATEINAARQRVDALNRGYLQGGKRRIFGNLGERDFD